MIPLLMLTSRNTEVDGTAAQLIRGYDGTTLNTDANLEKIMNPLKDDSLMFASAIKRMKEKSEQKTNDEIRDEKISGFYFLLVSFSHHPDALIRQAALNLLDIFNHYGLEIKEESFTRESSLLNSLLADLNKPKALADIALVPQCAEYIAALQQAHDTFEASRLAFESAQAEEGTLENASKIKQEVVNRINNQLVPYLNVMTQLDEPTYGAFARLVAELISANNEVVKKRRKKDEEPVME
ncbi:hypothetical protein INQ51_13905 [Maribellus sp. CM-23]|uniref:DUF6261 family protein n=1 Tax=Maribellus sp. CM-23 TaxID=2781026 RepID=UPI001F2A64C3|nr:DUF6261 family protein [Maribellus sp. CM-23]MCE4565408.1 hypothetical protein [Maribellus sp. CM-23]